MGKYNKYKKLAKLADIVRTASFGVAAYEDYGWWQVIWGTETIHGAYGLCGGTTPRISILGFKIPKFINVVAGIGSLAFAAGSLLTGDPRNAIVYGSASLGFLSNYAGYYFNQKAKDISLGIDGVPDKKLAHKVAICKKDSSSLVHKLDRIYYKRRKPGWKDKRKLKEIKKEYNKLEKILSNLGLSLKDHKELNPIIKNKYDSALININYVKEKLRGYDLSENIVFKALKKTGSCVKKVPITAFHLLNIGAFALFSYFAINSWDVYKDYFQDKTKYVNEQVTKNDVVIKFLENSKRLNEAYIKGDGKLIKKLTEEMSSIKSKVENRIEDLVECDLSLLAKDKVNVSTSFDRSECVLLLSGKYDLNVLNFYGYDFPIKGTKINPYLYRRLTDFEKLALQRLGESMGLDAKRLPVDSKEFKELTELMKQNYYLNDDSLENKIENKTNEIAISLGLTSEQIKNNKSTYSVYIGQIGGLTLNSPLFQLIKINDVQPSLKDMIFVYGHEAGHAYFMKNSNLFESLETITHLLLGGERCLIEETAADMVGELCIQEFYKNHLKEDSGLREEFLKDMQTPKANERRFEVVETFENLIREGRYDELKEYLDMYQEELKRKTNRPYTCMNSTLISIMKKYSGHRDVSENIRYIANNLGLKKFMSTIAGIHTFEQLDEVYNKLKN